MKKSSTVMAFGTFDFLHAGHLHYLQSAKKLAGTAGKGAGKKGKTHGRGKLVVVVARDRVALSEKGALPVNPEKDRLALVGALRVVDVAVLGSESAAERFAEIKKQKPAVLVLGYDAREDEDVLTLRLSAAGIRPLPKIVRAKPYLHETNKSSLLRKRLPLV
ncbi:MAG: adenylyltransferase/cytidyltransferase family protein [Candidatus Diapherotrites archaeon]